MGRLSQGDRVENLKDFVVLFLQTFDLLIDFRVLVLEIFELFWLLNLVETLDELVGKVIDPLVELSFDFDQRCPDVVLPVPDQWCVGRVFLNRLACELFNGFEVLHFFFEALVDVN